MGFANVEQLITDHIDLWTSAIENKSSSGRGSSKKQGLYGIKKLRELILELAVRGKLVPQNMNDEPASTLLEKIADERCRLIKEKKIKKRKKLPEIQAEDQLFELPTGWEWTQLGDVVEVLDSLRKPISKKDRTEGPYPYYGASGIVDYVADYIFDEDLVLIGEDGAKWGRGDYTAFTIGGKAWVNNHAHVVRTYQGLSDNFLVYALAQQDLQKYITGITVPKLNQAKLVSIVLPVPSLAEQERIVAKVDELMALCDKLEEQTENNIEAHQVLVETLLGTLTQSQNADELAENWERVAEHFDTLFTTEHSIDQLKQTILQLAVMGKLVPQDPSDEPAAALLGRIAREKEQLIKDKKIKNQKALPPISEVDQPFELPMGWEWARLEDLVDIQSGITKGRKLAGRKLASVPYLRVANVQRSYLVLEDMKEVEITIEEVEKYKVQHRDLLITEGGDWDKVGRTAIWGNELPYVAHQNHVFKARIFLEEQNEVWLETYLNAPYARDYFAGSSKQTTNLASINKTQLRGCLIALPPKSEIDRIVDKLGQFVNLCNLYRNKLILSKKNQLHLVDVMVENALS